MKGTDLAKQFDNLDEQEQLKFFKDIYFSDMKNKKTRKRPHESFQENSEGDKNESDEPNVDNHEEEKNNGKALVVFLIPHLLRRAKP